MSRKLASIQRVWKIEPIDGADRIELAHVLGWQGVVNKGQFHPMDLAVYFEIDSFLPIRPEFEFLRASSYRKTDLMGEGFRLRTMKFRGQISQGLLLPINLFPELSSDIELGTDVTEILGVRKWEIEEKATADGTAIGTLPIDVPHTDETRVQAEPDLIKDFANLEYYITTKLDGSSHSVSIDEDGFHRFYKGNRAPLGAFLLWQRCGSMSLCFKKFLTRKCILPLEIQSYMCYYYTDERSRWQWLKS